MESEELLLKHLLFEAPLSCAIREEDREARDIKESEFAFVHNREHAHTHVHGDIGADKFDRPENGDEPTENAKNDGDAADEFTHADETHETLCAEYPVEQAELLGTVLEEEQADENTEDKVETLLVLLGDFREERLGFVEERHGLMVRGEPRQGQGDASSRPLGENRKIWFDSSIDPVKNEPDFPIYKPWQK